MTNRRAGVAQPLPSRTPRGLLAGAVTMAFGLLYDLTGHGFAVSESAQAGGPSVGQHMAHLIVLAGMVLILVAIVRDGVRSTGRPRPEGSASHAVR